MHQAQAYIQMQGTALRHNGSIRYASLTATQAASLQLSLNNDAVDYFYSGSVSIGDALQAIRHSLFTWATVKLYYSVFYLTRGLLAIDGTAIVYEGSKPYSLSSLPGATPTRLAGTTHKAVLGAFTQAFPKSALLSQPIEGYDPLNWLMHRREEANYTNARFPEPEVPAHFSVLSKLGVRRSVAAYIDDKIYLYTFDPEHAMLALPIAALKESMQALNTSLVSGFDSDAHKYLATLFVDKSGPLSELVSLIKT
jgi:uncharacterized protein (UPF0332 family)